MTCLPGFEQAGRQVSGYERRGREAARQAVVQGVCGKRSILWGQTRACAFGALGPSRATAHAPLFKNWARASTDGSGCLADRAGVGRESVHGHPSAKPSTMVRVLSRFLAPPGAACNARAPRAAAGAARIGARTGVCTANDPLPDVCDQ